MRANKHNTIFIIAAGNGYVHEGIRGDGYKTFTPYYERNILDRILREICFRCPFLPKQKWYNQSISKAQADYVIVSDPLITVDFLKWVKKIFPQAQLNFTYGNMVGKARHIIPSAIPEGWRIWTYDDYDSRRYNLRVFHVNAYFRTFVKPKELSEYDVLFVGKDKGRGAYLLDLEAKMKSMGLKTKFIIAPDGRLSRNKTYYQKPISYRELVDLIVKSKSILNITMDGQEGITMRDLESLFLGVKLLTTNKLIVNSDIYTPENVYIVDGLNIDDLPDFLDKEMTEAPERIKKMHTMEHFVEVITEP